MRSVLVFLPILVLALLESTIIPLNLTLVAVILWASLRPVQPGLTVAFFSGLILDFLTGKTLGFSSLLALIAVLPVYFYKNRFQADRLGFLIPYTLIAVAIFNFGFGLFSLSMLPFTGILVAVFLPFFRFLAKISGDESQLKLSFEKKL